MSPPWAAGQSLSSMQSGPTDEAAATPLFDGLRAASETYRVPIVGGHTNARTDRSQLSVAILGRAKSLLTSFDARPVDRLVAAVDLRGRYREPFANWEAATDAPPARLCADLAVLPSLAEQGLAAAAKDISQAGLVGTAIMLAECSRVGVQHQYRARPEAGRRSRSGVGCKPSRASAFCWRFGRRMCRPCLPASMIAA